MKKHFLSLSFLSISALIGFSCSALAQDQENWLSAERFQLRARAIGIFADGDGQVAGTALKTDVGDSVTPEFDISYFFTDNIAAELILATAQHEVSAGSNDLGETWILPPTLTLQYHFTPEEKFSPYLGAGFNYSIFYGEDDSTGFNNLDVEGGLGYAVQVGFDYWLNDNWGFNLDAKYIDLDIDAEVSQGASRLRANDIDLDPVIIGAGISYRF